MLRSINPATAEVLQEYPEHGQPEVDAFITLMARAQRSWSAQALPERVSLLTRCAELLHERADALAELMAHEMGKPVSDGRAEAEKCASVCAYYAKHAEAFLAPVSIPTEAASSYVSFGPLGIVLAVMPWNFPLWQVFRAAAPTLVAGNGMLLKHASNVTGCALEIERIVRDAGGGDLFRTLCINSQDVARVIRHDAVAAVTVTGSVAAGRAVAKVAGSALKKCVLELGGSDPYLVLHDADVELAAEACAKGRLVNNGQSCIAAKRLIVHASIADAFEEALVRQMERRVMGDPLDDATDLGPMAREDLRDELDGQVRASVALGAHVACGGEIPSRKGAWYPPTVLTNVTADMPAGKDEVFGPVAAVMRVSGEEEAIAVANASRFGLASAVFSRDVERAEHLARHVIEAGACFVNQPVASDPRLPFGGIKDSGYGRELGRWGIHEFVNAKTVSIHRG